MMNSEYEALKGRYVLFRVRDIHLPLPTVVLQELHGGQLLEGRVVDFSDNGQEGGAFVVIEVDGLRSLCVLAVERILCTLRPAQDVIGERPANDA